MKRAYVFIIIAVLWIIPNAGVAELLSSRISEVTLFSGEALVRREATATVRRGLQELWIEVDAFRVDEDSVSAKVFGAGEIYSVQLKEISAKESPREKIQILEKKVKALQRSKRALLDEKEVWAKKEQFLDALVTFSETQVPKDVQTRYPKVEELSKTMAFLGSHLQSVKEGNQAIDAKLEDLDGDINVLKEELAALGATPQKMQRIVEIVFNSSRDQTVTVDATYLARNALWEPLYKISVPPTLKAIDLTMFSRIRQKTGEDWKHVKLSLSNVIPLRGATPPEPSSWILDVPRSRAKAFRRKAGTVLEQAVPVPSAEVLEDKGYEEVATVARARTKELPLSFEYEIPRTMTIESRDKETILPLFERDLDGEFFHYAVPKERNLTFLVCEAKADRELLSGPLNVYFGGRYVGKTALREKKAGEKFRMNLGADRNVKVSRVKLKDKVKETLFGSIERKTILREFVYKITIENLKDAPIRIMVLDSIPVSRTDKITVNDIKMAPEPTERDYGEKEGVMLWQHELASGEKREVTIEFVVSYPKDVPVTGLW